MEAQISIVVPLSRGHEKDVEGDYRSTLLNGGRRTKGEKRSRLRPTVRTSCRISHLRMRHRNRSETIKPSTMGEGRFLLYKLTLSPETLSEGGNLPEILKQKERKTYCASRLVFSTNAFSRRNVCTARDM